MFAQLRKYATIAAKLTFPLLDNLGRGTPSASSLDDAAQSVIYFSRFCLR